MKIYTAGSLAIACGVSYKGLKKWIDSGRIQADITEDRPKRYYFLEENAKKIIDWHNSKPTHYKLKKKGGIYGK